MSLTKVSYAMINKAPLSVIDYGADATGTNDSTNAIEAAITAAQLAETAVTFPPGTYKITSGITVDPAVSFVGQAGATISFEGQIPVTAASAWLIFKNGSFFEISNLKFDGNSRNGTLNGYGVQIYNCTDFVIQNNLFYDVYKGNLGLTEASSYSNCERVQILNNRFTPVDVAAQEGIGITGINICTIQGNIIDNPIDDAIAFHGTNDPSVPCNNVLIVDNILGNSIYTTAISASGRLLLENGCNDFLIANNLFYGTNVSNYVALAFQNVLVSPWSEAYPKNITIANNKFNTDADSTGNPTGILMGCGAQVDIVGNTFTNFFSGINVTVQPSGELQQSNNINIDGNSFYTFRVTQCFGISIGSYDFPTIIPTDIYVTNNFFNNNMYAPIQYEYAMDGQVGQHKYANNTASGSASLIPPLYPSGTPKYYDFNNNFWNYSTGGIAPVSGRWSNGTIQWSSTSSTSGGYIGSVCTAGGAPGTWKTFGTIS